MEKTGKLACGALATIMLAIGSHHLGNGDALLRALESEARAALARQGMGTLEVAFERDPMRRVALLSGPADAATRSTALRTVAELPGISTARWVGPTSTAAYSQPVHHAAAPSTACRTRVQDALAGHSINFRRGSPWVNPEARRTIAAIATTLDQCPYIQIAITGYAEGYGKNARAMAQARADAVKAVLVSHGIAAPRIAATGQGTEAAQARDAATQAGRRATIMMEED